MTASGVVEPAPWPPERIVVVGAGLAGAHAAQELRHRGYRGVLTVVGAEAHPPYDRPPLSKWVATGQVGADETALPEVVATDAEWRLGVAATGLDRQRRVVALADGSEVGYDRLLIATGMTSLPWSDAEEAALDGVLSVRTIGDGLEIARRLREGPRRVLVVGAGFTGSEVASACRHLGVDVTVIDRADYPLENALGQAFGTLAAQLQRGSGIDLRMGTSLAEMFGDELGRLRRVRFDDGSELDVDVAVICVGASRNLEWLEGSGLVFDRGGLTCDATLRVATQDAAPGGVDSAVYAAGDVARWPHPVYGDLLVSVEHWGTTVEHAQLAARNMLVPGGGQEVYAELPRFWSNQFGVNIKQIGIPHFADSVAVVQGSLETQRGVIAYGHEDRLVGVTGVDCPREVEAYVGLVERGAAFPPVLNPTDFAGRSVPKPVPAGFPRPGGASHDPTATVQVDLPDDPALALGLAPRADTDDVDDSVLTTTRGAGA